jgi:hypothetical protein
MAGRDTGYPWARLLTAPASSTEKEIPSARDIKIPVSAKFVTYSQLTPKTSLFMSR